MQFAQLQVDFLLCLTLLESVIMVVPMKLESDDRCTCKLFTLVCFFSRYQILCRPREDRASHQGVARMPQPHGHKHRLLKPLSLLLGCVWVREVRSRRRELSSSVYLMS